MPRKIVVNIETGEAEEREMTPDELTEREQARAEDAAVRAAAAATAQEHADRRRDMDAMLAEWRTRVPGGGGSPP